MELNYDIKKLATITAVILLMFNLILMGWVLVKLTNEGSKCILDPIEYYNDLGDDMCFCFSDDSSLNPSFANSFNESPS